MGFAIYTSLLNETTSKFMNVYSCWYEGNFGYACRIAVRKWMFVPEMGQPDANIYKNLLLEDLTFKFAFENSFE